MPRSNAFFLWLGSELPDIARCSVLSAAEAGFDTVLFTDRPQTLAHSKVRLADWREVPLPWTPEQVRLRGESKPCYAAFSDLFRFALLSERDGWWFDCDTLIVRSAADFAALLRPGKLVVGREDGLVINGAVLGSCARDQARLLYLEASSAFPILERWGVVGPALITRLIAESRVDAHVVSQQHFYPVHHNDIARIYQPSHCTALLAEEPDWYCLSLWNEVLSRSGLKFLAPPDGSYLGNLLARLPALGGIRGNDAAMADFLSTNLLRINDADSGRRAMSTLVRKAKGRLRGLVGAS